MKPRSTTMSKKHRAHMQAQPNLVNPVTESKRRSPRLLLKQASQSTNHVPISENIDNFHTSAYDINPTKDCLPKYPQNHFKVEHSTQETHQPRSRKESSSKIDADAHQERPKRYLLTAKNLRKFDEMGKRQTRATKATNDGLLVTTNTTDRKFGEKLRRNNIIHNGLDTQPADDAHHIKTLLDRKRTSEPPDRLAYNQYLARTAPSENELAVSMFAYPALSKQSAEREVFGYLPKANHAWCKIDNQLTTGLSDARPDMAESYRARDFPGKVLDDLSGDFIPSAFDEVIPTYAVEFKSSEGDMAVAKLQCAYDGALMTEGARTVHKYLGKSDDSFYGKTQALTVAFNGEDLKFYGHYALQFHGPSLPADQVSETESVDRQYQQYLIAADHPRESFDAFQRAYKHVRNAQDIGFEWATERKVALWTHQPAVRARREFPPSQPHQSSVVVNSSSIPDPRNETADTIGHQVPEKGLTEALNPILLVPLSKTNPEAIDDNTQLNDQLKPLQQSTSELSTYFGAKASRPVKPNASRERKTRARKRRAEKNGELKGIASKSRLRTIRM